MTISKLSFIDTNILVYAAVSLRDKGLSVEIPLGICPQVLHEFFAIVTDPRRVSNPRTLAEARTEVDKYFRSENILKICPGPDIIEDQCGACQTKDH